MNATEGSSPTKALYCYQTRCLIPSHPTPTAAPLPTAPAAPLYERSNTLIQTRQESCTFKVRGSHNSNNYLNRTPTRLPEPRLAKPPLAAVLLQSDNNLLDPGHTVATSRNEKTFWEVDSKYKKNIIYHMFRLKDHGIEITLDACNIQRKALTRLSALYPFNDNKVSTSSLDPCLKLNGNPEFSIDTLSAG